jgi:cyclopropane fatty-acyl-phospholipid synthase-like methyltransferase
MLNFKQEKFAPFVRIVAPMLLRLGFKETVRRAARVYVSTDETSGELQRELLERTGCTPTSKVLEIGCGFLNAGIPIIRFLAAGNYVGIEPNRWLIDAALTKRDARNLVKEKHARFLYSDTFDASELGIEFDFVISHSVLSHCAHRQLDQFLRTLGRVLASNGCILASLRLSEGNPYGSAGSTHGEDSMYETWQYPGVSYFKLSTVEKTARDNCLIATLIPEYTEYCTSRRPQEVHDWFVFSRASFDSTYPPE